MAVSKGEFLSCRCDEHHRAAHFVFHALDAEHPFRRLRLGYAQQFKAVRQQPVDIGGQRFVIFDDLFSEKARAAHTFVKVVVDGEVQDIARAVALPVLRTLRGKYRMFR